MKYVLLDLDGTLLDFKASEKKAFINTIYKFKDIIPSDDICLKFSQINEELFNEFAKGNLKRIEFQRLRFKKMTELLNTDIDEVKFNEFYVKNLEVQAELYNDAIILLDYLKNKYKLYVASNGMYKVQINRLKIAKILDYFTDIFISEDIGYNKPDPNFFKAIISKIGDNNLDEYIIIGDRIDADIKGGISFGINAILVNRDNIKTKYKNVKNLKDIIGIL